MAVLFLIFIATAPNLVDGVRECPPWFEWMNTSHTSGYCACAKKLPSCIDCDQRNQISWLLQGSCAFYDSKEDKLSAYWCHFRFKRNSKNGMFPLPSNVSELNSVVCGNLNREVKPPLCGRCTNGTGPSIYSVGSSCVPSCSPVKILYYLLLQYLPSTVMYILLLVFRPNITSAPMANFVIFCNSVVLYFRFILLAYVTVDSIFIGKLALTLSALWSFDILFFVAPPFCISQHIQEFYLPFLEFLATAYPFILFLLTYGLIKLHASNFKPVVVLWRPLSRTYVQFYRAWD